MMTCSRRLLLCSIVVLAASAPVGAASKKKAPKPEHFLGKWVGKWDGKWTVQFTVSRDPESQELVVLYEWEERLGQPLGRDSFYAGFEDGKLLVGDSIDITLSGNDPNKATANGHFQKPRVAELTRAKKPVKKRKK
jgi:hypothetical protein